MSATDRFSGLLYGLLLAWLGALIEPAAVPGSFLALLALASGAGLARLVSGWLEPVAARGEDVHRGAIKILLTILPHGLILIVFRSPARLREDTVP